MHKHESALTWSEVDKGDEKRVRRYKQSINGFLFSLNVSADVPKTDLEPILGKSTEMLRCKLLVNMPVCVLGQA